MLLYYFSAYFLFKVQKLVQLLARSSMINQSHLPIVIRHSSHLGRLLKGVPNFQ